MVENDMVSSFNLLPVRPGATCDMTSEQRLFPGRGWIRHWQQKNAGSTQSQVSGNTFFRSLALKNQEAMVMKTDRKKDREKWSKKVKERMREGRAEREKSGD